MPPKKKVNTKKTVSEEVPVSLEVKLAGNAMSEVDKIL